MQAWGNRYCQGIRAGSRNTTRSDSGSITGAAFRPRVLGTGCSTFRGGETGRLCHGWDSSSSRGSRPAARQHQPSPGWRPGFRSWRTNESSEAYSGTHTFCEKFRLYIDRRSNRNIIYGGEKRHRRSGIPANPSVSSADFARHLQLLSCDEANKRRK